MESLVLNDKTIRTSLIYRLNRLYPPPKTILEELRVHNGNAIADVVTVHSGAHCYEIKGENDNIHRILKQSRYYDLVFKKVTLVTTDKHIDSALRLAPTHWGILKVSAHKGNVKFSYLRPALPSPVYNKTLALLTLWKSELIELASTCATIKAEKLNRTQLSDLLADSFTGKAINQSIGEKLSSRNKALD